MTVGDLACVQVWVCCLCRILPVINLKYNTICFRNNNNTFYYHNKQHTSLVINLNNFFKRINLFMYHAENSDHSDKEVMVEMTVLLAV